MEDDLFEVYFGATLLGKIDGYRKTFTGRRSLKVGDGNDQFLGLAVHITLTSPPDGVSEVRILRRSAYFAMLPLLFADASESKRRGLSFAKKPGTQFRPPSGR